MTLAKVTVSVCWELHQAPVGGAVRHAGCGKLYNPCMRVEGLCNLCVLRLCNTCVERFTTYMYSGWRLLIPCVEGLRVLVLALIPVHRGTKHK